MIMLKDIAFHSLWYMNIKLNKSFFEFYVYSYIAGPLYRDIQSREWKIIGYDA